MMPDRWQRNIKMHLSGKSRASIKQQQTAAERWRSRSAFKVFISRSVNVWQERRRLVSTSQEEHTVTIMIRTYMKYLTQTNINCVQGSVPAGLLHTGACSSLHQTHCSENKSTFSLLPVSFWKVRSIFIVLYFYWKLFLLPRNTTLKRTNQCRQKETLKQTRQFTSCPVCRWPAATMNPDGPDGPDGPTSSWESPSLACSYLNAGAKAGQSVRGHRCALKAGEVPQVDGRHGVCRLGRLRPSLAVQ